MTNIITTKKNQFVLAIVIALLSIFLVVEIFSGKIILPQYFFVFGFKIYFYGLTMGLAVLTAYLVAVKRLSKFSLNRSDLDNIVLILIINGFIGARLYHVFSSFSYYQNHWAEVFYVWNGGLSIFGAIIGALIGVFTYQRYYLTNQISFYKLLDFLAPSVIIGQIIGRFGNLFNYEAYGTPTNNFLKMFVPVEFRIPPYETFSFFHPLFFYEALAGLLILIILLKWVDIAAFLKVNLRSGQIFLLWLGLYNCVRFLTETLRIDSPYLFGIKQNLLTSALLVLISAILFIKITYFNNEFKST